MDVMTVRVLYVEIRRNLNIVTTEGGAIVMWGGTLGFILEGRYLDESGDVEAIKNGQSDQLFWVKEDFIARGKELKREFRFRMEIRCEEAVSYTHLTLPTNREV